MTISMTPGLRKFALTAHITLSVGLLGSIAAFLAVSVAGLAAEDAHTVRAAYPAMELIARLVIVPLAFASLLTGLIQSFGTQWGLFRHYWVLAKFLLTVFATTVLLVKLELISYAARLAAETILPRAELYAAGLELAIHAAGGLFVLLLPTALSVYKPRGLTPYGRRCQGEQRTPHRPGLPSQRPLINPGSGAGASLGGESVSITLRRMYMYGIIVVVLVLHILILHLTGSAPGWH